MNLNDRRKNAVRNENGQMPNSESSTNTTDRSLPQMQELLQKQSEKLQSQTETIQRLSSELQMLQSKTAELTEELSDTQKLNRALQKSNDDLRNNAGVNTIAEQKELNARITTVTAANKKLQEQVRMSNVEAVKEARKDARQSRMRAEIAEKERDKALEEAKNTAESVRWKTEIAEDHAKEKYRGMIDSYYGKHLLIMVYCLTVTIAEFVKSERCRADTAVFFGGIWNIVKTVVGWEEDLFTLGIGGIIGGIACMIGIPIALIFLTILLVSVYQKTCMRQNVSGCSTDEKKHAIFRTEMVAIFTAVVPVYLVDILPEGWNYWGILLMAQLIYFYLCCCKKDD